MLLVFSSVGGRYGRGRYVNGEAESKPPNFCLFFLLLIKRKYNTYTTSSVRYTKGKIQIRFCGRHYFNIQKFIFSLPPLIV